MGFCPLVTLSLKLLVILLIILNQMTKFEAPSYNILRYLDNEFSISKFAKGNNSQKKIHQKFTLPPLSADQVWSS